MTPPPARRAVFVTGASGFMGSRLVRALLDRGHAVTALVRPGSESRVPQGATVVLGDALHGMSYASRVSGCDTFVHLVGVAHPSPARARDFLRIDLASVEAAVPVALVEGVRHFIYVSVAHPAPVMQAYIAARMKGEELVRNSGMPATVLRPWYVLGPGRYWPLALLPAYWVLSVFPPTRPGARRLGLVRWTDMIAALVHAVEEPSDGFRVMDVPAIRQAGRRIRA